MQQDKEQDMLINDSSTRFGGLWAAEPKALKAAIDSIQLNRAAEHDPEEDERRRRDSRLQIVGNGVAVIQINGVMTKGSSIMTMLGLGTSTLETRRLLVEAHDHPDVNAIMILADSPGGQVAGTMELAQTIKDVQALKPVWAFISDEGASALLWAVAAVGRIASNEMAMIGSIGVFTVIEDLSEAAANAGIKVHVISTGEFKGQADGAPVSDAQIAEIQGLVDSVNEKFLTAIRKGRGMSAAAVKKVATGEVFMAEEALSLGLIDKISTLEKSISDLGKFAVKGSNRARAAQAKIDLAELE